MKSCKWDSSSNRVLKPGFRILVIAFTISLVHASLVCARAPQDKFGWPPTSNSETGLKLSAQQLPPESAKVRYPLPARNSAGELRLSEQPLSESDQPSIEQHPPSRLESSTRDSKLESKSIPQEIHFNQPYRLTSRFHLEEGTRRGYLILQVELAPGAYIHSLTQGNDLNPSRVKAVASSQYKTIDDFLADRDPTIVEKDPVFEQRLEKHLESVQFFAPLELSEGVEAEQLQPNLIFDGQVCTEDGVCIPLSKQNVPARFGGYFHRSAQKNSENIK